MAHVEPCLCNARRLCPRPKYVVLIGNEVWSRYPLYLIEEAGGRVSAWIALSLLASVALTMVRCP